MLKLWQRPNSPYWYITGSVSGQVVYESTKTTDRTQAEQMLEARQGILYRKFIKLTGEEPVLSKEMTKELVSLAQRSRNRSQKKGLGTGLSVEDVTQLFIAQRGKCAVSGVDFHLEGESSRDRAFAPSIDRIDNAKGYTPDNVRLVCRIANYAMNIWGDRALMTLSLGVTAVWEQVVAKSMTMHLAQFRNEDKLSNENNKKGPLDEHHAAQV